MTKTILACVMILAAGCAVPTEDAKVDITPTVEMKGKPFPPGGRRITLDCGPGENASAVGSYGGISVSLSCSNGRSSNTVIVPTGNLYDFFVGVETPCCGVDAHPSGDAETFAYQYYGTTFTATLN